MLGQEASAMLSERRLVWKLLMVRMLTVGLSFCVGFLAGVAQDCAHGAGRHAWFVLPCFEAHHHFISPHLPHGSPIVSHAKFRRAAAHTERKTRVSTP